MSKLEELVIALKIEESKEKPNKELCKELEVSILSYLKSIY